MRPVGHFVFVLILTLASPFDAAEPIRYRLSFPEAQHRWMQIEVLFPDVAASMLELRMSRSSPGRYLPTAPR